MTKFFAAFLMMALVTCAAQPTLASKNKQIGDWTVLSRYLDTQIAVKAKDKKTVFGVLRAVESDTIKVEVSGKNNFSEIVYQRDQVQKVWLATPKGGRDAGKGALVGAGLGATIGAVAGATAKEKDPLNYAGVLLFGLAGGALGGMVGLKERNKKRQLIYSV